MASSQKDSCKLPACTESLQDHLVVKYMPLGLGTLLRRIRCSGCTAAELVLCQPKAS